VEVTAAKRKGRTNRRYNIHGNPLEKIKRTTKRIKDISHSLYASDTYNQLDKHVSIMQRNRFPIYLNGNG
jgi:hypothetical protein